MGNGDRPPLGSGRTLFLADASRGQPRPHRRRVARRGLHGCTASSPTSPTVRPSRKLSRAGGGRRGRVVAVAHTAGVSASIASARTILEVDLLGTVHVIEHAFEVCGGGARAPPRWSRCPAWCRRAPRLAQLPKKRPLWPPPTAEELLSPAPS
ncbi:hypothetical protein ACRAWF_21375 [Streptomyces sp. L7]